MAAASWHATIASSNRRTFSRPSRQLPKRHRRHRGMPDRDGDIPALKYRAELVTAADLIARRRALAVRPRGLRRPGARRAPVVAGGCGNPHAREQPELAFDN
jgi:hypothetical protein